MKEGALLASNITSTHPAAFLLVGIPGLEQLHVWISIPFCFVYTLALPGNLTLLSIIRADTALHEPMCLFLAVLAATDLVLSSTALPKMLAIFWFRDQEINFYASLVQMFFLHSFSIMESAVLLAMAFDRYVAICKPLHYITILTGPLITKTGLAAVTQAVTLMTPLPFLLRCFHYCRGPVIVHCYYEYVGVVRLACGDTHFNNIHGIAVAMFIVVLDLLFFVLSYIFILRAVLQLASQEAHYKAFGTCVSHIGAILSTYTPVVICSVIHHVAHRAAPHVHIFLATFYLLFSPMVNPIYGVKTKQIRDLVQSIPEKECIDAYFFP
ncbi:LOW QUALITY PROTEIN: olfactory receptor 52K1-like [Mesoplodon densirostris]|uniref:LOW QUALITY PROTEIN: olfactory receptor 52K1-like n=1 Tax=Mesoplodon densirostris TaxID=48708 RepID=UPI0028DBA2E3|nr:LOW QUALITY PROTEIN: olfactory receptor 52K1-like [Mesoplodon densirostris]